MNKLRKHGVYYDSRIKLLLILLTSALAFALGGGLTGLCVPIFFSLHDVSGKPIVVTIGSYYIFPCSS